jgi:hypothetical protein
LSGVFMGTRSGVNGLDKTAGYFRMFIGRVKAFGLCNVHPPRWIAVA